MGAVIPKIRRPDPARMVKVTGPLTMAAAGRVAAAVRQLAQSSAAPITLHIRSGGGEVAAFYQLAGEFDTLRCQGKKCRVFTLAHEARSAAAYLLLAGHRAYALPHTKVGLHGTRGALPKNGKLVSRETALAIAMHLDRENRTVARILSKHLILRLAARRRELLASSAPPPGKTPRDQMENFTLSLAAQLDSKQAQRLLHQSFERLKLIFALSPLFLHQPHPSGPRTLAAREVKIFQAALAYEFADNRGTKWRLGPTAGAELLMDYLLAKDFLPGDHLKLVRRLARRFGRDFLSKSAIAQYERLQCQSPSRAEKFLINAALPDALGLWYFTLTLCHRLLAGDLTFSAQDAYWLGLVDEVLPAEPLTVPSP